MGMYNPEKRLANVQHIWLVYDDGYKFYLGAFRFKNSKDEKAFIKEQQYRYKANSHYAIKNTDILYNGN